MGWDVVGLKKRDERKRERNGGGGFEGDGRRGEGGSDEKSDCPWWGGKGRRGAVEADGDVGGQPFEAGAKS